MEKNRVYEKAVFQLKAAGQSIIDNAEVIVGGYKYQTGDVDVTITIDPDGDAPTIDVRQSLLPEAWVESLSL